MKKLTHVLATAKSLLAKKATVTANPYFCDSNIDKRFGF